MSISIRKGSCVSTSASTSPRSCGANEADPSPVASSTRGAILRLFRQFRFGFTQKTGTGEQADDAGGDEGDVDSETDTDTDAATDSEYNGESEVNAGRQLSKDHDEIQPASNDSNSPPSSYADKSTETPRVEVNKEHYEKTTQTPEHTAGSTSQSRGTQTEDQISAPVSIDNVLTPVSSSELTVYESGAKSWPYNQYRDIHQGYPIRFLVGSHLDQFDVHSSILTRFSPLFHEPSEQFPETSHPITLSPISAADFSDLLAWLYGHKAPRCNSSADLPSLMRLWITAGALGMRRTQNLVMGLAVRLMQSPRHTIEMETVHHVYKHTRKDSPLRKFVVAVLCQRAAGGEPGLFSGRYLGVGIWEDVIGFMKVLEGVRRSSSGFGVQGCLVSAHVSFETERILKRYLGLWG